MKITRTTYQDLGTAYRCENGDLELIVLANMGPRVISLRFKKGENILFEDRENKYTRDQWRLWGGHRFWVGPETEHAFVPDNEPCQTEIRDTWLVLTQPPDRMGLQKRLEIGPCPGRGGFILRHVVENVGRLLYPGAIWTLTCANPFPVVVPWAAGSDRWQCNMARYWVKWDSHQTDPAAAHWIPRRDYFALEPGREEGKVGLYTERGFLALLRPDSTFIKMHRPLLHASYPDGGCNVELYTCSQFVEMETLSPIMVFHPGETYVHEERWLVLDKRTTADQWRALADELPPWLPMPADGKLSNA